PAVEVEEVEDEVADRLVPRADGVLQCAEVAPPLRVEDHDLAVQPGRAQRQLAEHARERAEANAPVVRLAREEAGAPVLEAREDAIAVELDLVQPVASLGRRVDERGEL